MLHERNPDDGTLLFIGKCIHKVHTYGDSEFHYIFKIMATRFATEDHSLQ